MEVILSATAGAFVETNIGILLYNNTESAVIGCMSAPAEISCFFSATSSQIASAAIYQTATFITIDENGKMEDKV
jgi:hypothetical protein